MRKEADDMKFPDMSKLKAKLPRRVDAERLLIVGAAALVVVLALRGGEEPETTMVYSAPPVSASVTRRCGWCTGWMRPNPPKRQGSTPWATR